MSATDYNLLLQQANYMQELLAGINADKIPPGAIAGVTGYAPNGLVNGGMEIWNRGTGAFTTNNAKLADQWAATLSGGSSYSVSRGTAIAPGSQYNLSFAYTHVGGGALVIAQNIENWAEYKGKTVCFSATVVAGAANALILGVVDGVGAGYSAYAGNNILQTLTATLAVSTSATVLQVQIIMSTASMAFGSVDNCILSVGAAYPFAPEPLSQARLRTERYWQQVRPVSRYRSSTAGESHSDPVYWRCQMASAPTATIAAGARTNVASAAVGNITATGASYDTVATATATDTQAVADVITADAFY